jgi:hypothetical protein
MSNSKRFNIKSFIIIIYDPNHEELASYQVPISVAAPFANRLFREIPDIDDLTLREPWYVLIPRQEARVERSPLPSGPTSLYGQFYDPATQSPPTISMSRDALVQYFVVRLLEFQKELYEGVYSVDDIFLHGVHYLLHHRIKKGDLPDDKGPYYYEVVPSSRTSGTMLTDLFPEDAYEVEGMFRLPPHVKDEPRIIFTKRPDPPLPEREPKIFEPTRSYGSGEPQVGRVYIPSHLYDELHYRMKLSNKKEEGGYILGNVFRVPDSPEEDDDPGFQWLVEVTDLLMAEDTIGSFVTLLFTGDSWSKISRRRTRDYPDRKLVGWFHTHLFPATDDFGLSGLDQDMHAWYLTKPWQVAILLNFEHDGNRTIRCYQRGTDGDLVETPFEVFELDA